MNINYIFYMISDLITQDLPNSNKFIMIDQLMIVCKLVVDFPSTSVAKERSYLAPLLFKFIQYMLHATTKTVSKYH
jgi:hypothetical protein